MRRLLSSCGMLALFLLAGCFGGGEEDALSPENIQFQHMTTAGIGLEKPSSWNYLTHEENPTELPEGVLMLLTAPEPWGAGETFATIAVAREELPTGTSSKQYAAAGMAKTKNEITEYRRLGEEDVNIQGNEGKLLRFTGRNSLEDADLEWQHLFLAQGRYGYVVSSTAAKDASEDQKNLLRRIVTSFTFSGAE